MVDTDVTVGEFRIIARNFRVWFLRLPIAFGFAVLISGRGWSLWSKRGTLSRVIAQWINLDIRD